MDANIIFHYLKGTYQHGIKYCHSIEPLVEFNNYDWGGAIDDRKSTSSYLFRLMSCKKQKVLCILTTETEYCGIVNAGT